MVELEARSPVGSPQQRLQGTGQVHEHVAHEEEPEGDTNTGSHSKASKSFFLCPGIKQRDATRGAQGVCWLSFRHIHWQLHVIPKQNRDLPPFCVTNSILSTLVLFRERPGTGLLPDLPQFVLKNESKLERSLQCSHGEDGSHRVQGGDEDAALTDTSCQQEGPCGFSVGLPVAEDLKGPQKLLFMPG